MSWLIEQNPASQGRVLKNKNKNYENT